MAMNYAFARILDKGVGVGALGLAVFIPLPYILGVAGPSSAVVPLIFVAAALLLARTEPPSERRGFLSLFAWAFIARLTVLLVLWGVLLPEKPGFLGPDAGMFFRVSELLADNGFRLNAHPITVLGSYDVAHYYLFAAAIRLLGSDLFTLKLVNSGLTALVAPLLFSWSRSAIPQHGAVLGLVVALHPSLIVLSTVDLLKDPSIVFFMTLFIWSLTRAMKETRLGSKVGFAALSVAGIAYLRMDRAYVVAHLELAALAVFLLSAFRWRSLSPVFRRGIVVAAIVFVAAEGATAVLGWPAAPILVYLNAQHVFGVPAMWDYELKTVGPVLEQSLSKASLARGLKTVAYVFRRLYGPFVWIMPNRWDLRGILAADFALYPGMVVSYALLPFAMIGLAVTGWRFVFRKEENVVLSILALFLLSYFTQYVLLNLSWRQREVMVPFLLVFGFIGLVLARRYRWWKHVYAIYWLVLLTVAAAHMAVRLVAGSP